MKKTAGMEKEEVAGTAEERARGGGVMGEMEGNMWGLFQKKGDRRK